MKMELNFCLGQASVYQQQIQKKAKFRLISLLQPVHLLRLPTAVPSAFLAKFQPPSATFFSLSEIFHNLIVLSVKYFLVVNKA